MKNFRSLRRANSLFTSVNQGYHGAVVTQNVLQNRGDVSVDISAQFCKNQLLIQLGPNGHEMLQEACDVAESLVENPDYVNMILAAQSERRVQKQVILAEPGQEKVFCNEIEGQPDQFFERLVDITRQSLDWIYEVFSKIYLSFKYSDEGMNDEKQKQKIFTYVVTLIAFTIIFSRQANI